MLEGRSSSVVAVAYTAVQRTQLSTSARHCRSAAVRVPGGALEVSNYPRAPDRYALRSRACAQLRTLLPAICDRCSWRRRILPLASGERDSAGPLLAASQSAALGCALAQVLPGVFRSWLRLG